MSSAELTGCAEENPGASYRISKRGVGGLCVGGYAFPPRSLPASIATTNMK